MRIFIPLLTITAVGVACANHGSLPTHRTSTVASPAPPLEPAVASNTDPTVGELTNQTRWRVEVFIDVDPDSLGAAPSITLSPKEARPSHIDLGPHRVIALAFVDTQFGTRLVGQYDRSIQVNPRGGGWSLRFTEEVFR